jgi:hypothetical protein
MTMQSELKKKFPHFVGAKINFKKRIYTLVGWIQTELFDGSLVVEEGGKSKFIGKFVGEIDGHKYELNPEFVRWFVDKRLITGCESYTPEERALCVVYKPE